MTTDQAILNVVTAAMYGLGGFCLGLAEAKAARKRRLKRFRQLLDTDTSAGTLWTSDKTNLTATDLPWHRPQSGPESES